jgi:hypothetical protein
LLYFKVNMNIGGSSAQIRTLILLSLSVCAYPADATGPAVGQQIPGFSAPDQNGRIQSLKTIVGPKGAMLVFYRSADW